MEVWLLRGSGDISKNSAKNFKSCLSTVPSFIALPKHKSNVAYVNCEGLPSQIC